MLYIRVRISLDDLLDLEGRRLQVACHLVGAKKEEVDIHRLAQPRVQMEDIVADVERQQKPPAGSEHAPELTQGSDHVSARDVDDRVEGRDAGPCTVCTLRDVETFRTILADGSDPNCLYVLRALRPCRQALEQYPTLRFAPISVSTGPRTVLIEYRRSGVDEEEPTVELLELDADGLIVHPRVYHAS